MATRAELEAALRAADAAGNADDARALATALHNFQDPAPHVSDAAKLKAEWEAMPFGPKLKTFGNDQARLFLNALTFGGADNIAAKLEGHPVDIEKNKTADARARGGNAATMLELGTSFIPAGLVSKGVGLATKLKGATWGETALREGLAGTATGTTAAALDGKNGEDIATQGGITGILSGVLGGAGSKVADWVSQAANKLGIKSSAIADKVIPPRTRSQMRGDTNAAYDAVDRMGVRYDPNDYQAMTNRLDAALQTKCINPNLHPRAVEMSSIIRPKPGGPITPRSLDELRQQISRDVTGSAGEKMYGNIMREHIDDFLDTGATTTGNATAQEAGEALRKARDLSRRGRIMDDLNEAAERGENSASGMGDVEYLRTLLNNKNRRRGMTPEELSAARKVVRGSSLENGLRDAASGGIPLTPLGTGIIVGGATGDPGLGLLAGGGVAVGKPLLRRAARNYTDRNMEELLSTIAGGSRDPSTLKKVVGPLAVAKSTQEVDEDRDEVEERKRNRYGYR